MHELNIIQNIFPLIEKVAKDNNLKSISKVVLSVGMLRQVQADFLQFAFTIVAQNTIAHNAELIIKLSPIELFCQACKTRFIVQENIYVCPKCGSVSFEYLSGKEIILESLDGEK